MDILDEERDIVITKEDGSEVAMKILFYFHHDERGKDYYFLYKEETPDDIIVLSTADGESFETLDEEEFDEAQQVFDAYQEDPAIQDLKDGD